MHTAAYTGQPQKLGKPCLIRIRGLTYWLRGEWTGSTRAKVTEADPVWFGAEVTRNNAQLRAVHETEER